MKNEERVMILDFGIRILDFSAIGGLGILDCLACIPRLAP
jgi:hypothetical protein